MGDPLGLEEKAKIDFLSSHPSKGEGSKKAKQSNVKYLTGINWSVYEILHNVVRSVVQHADDFELMGGWGDWPACQEGSGDELWGVLDELDEQQCIQGSDQYKSDNKSGPKQSGSKKPTVKAKKRARGTK